MSDPIPATRTTRVPSSLSFDPEVWYSASEFAARMGWRRQTVLNRRSEGRSMPPAARGARGQLLFLGADINEWLRLRREGERPGGRKLDVGQVDEIRRLLAKGVARPLIAERFGVSTSTVHGIAQRRTHRTSATAAPTRSSGASRRSVR